MRAPAKSAIAMFGGAAAVILTVGFGGIAVSPSGGTSSTTTPLSVSVTPAQPDVAGPGVHNATLAGCVSGLDC